jgi:hypothetical protein
MPLSAGTKLGLYEVLSAIVSAVVETNQAEMVNDSLPGGR